MNNKYLIIALLTVAGIVANADVTYNIYAGGDLAADTDWNIVEGLQGVDADADGLLDGSANHGAIVTSDGNTGWQLNDQNAGGDYNLPQLQYAFNPTLAAEMGTKGFTLTVEIENLNSARSGFWFGYDNLTPFAGSDQRLLVGGTANIPADGETHTVTLSWNAITSIWTRTVDGTADTPSFANSSANGYTGADDGSAMMVIDSGSSTNTGAKWNLVSAEMTVIPEPATLGMVVAFGGGILFIRRKLMM